MKSMLLEDSNKWRIVAIVLAGVLCVVVLMMVMGGCLWRYLRDRRKTTAATNGGICRNDEKRESEKLLVNNNQNKYQCFSKSGLGQCELSYEEIKQTLNETFPETQCPSSTPQNNLTTRGSFVGTPNDYWPASGTVSRNNSQMGHHKRGYGSISDSLSIARTESCKSRKTSTDSGIAGSIGIGSVIPDLYQRRGTIVRRQSSPTHTSCGTVYLKLLYLFKSSDLLVKVEQVSNIPPDIIQRIGKGCNPFLILEMVPPVDNVIRQTALRESQTSPVFSDTFRFPIAYDYLYNHTLHLALLTLNLTDMTKHKFGRAKLCLDAVDPSMEIDIWLDLTIMEPERRITAAKLLLSLNYLSAAERLTLLLMKAKDVVGDQSNQSDSITITSIPSKLDYYIKIEQFIEGKVIKRRKTAVKSSDNLEWNEEVILKIKHDQIDQTMLFITMYQRTKSEGDLIVGDLKLGKHASTLTGRQHWWEIFGGQNEGTVVWHELKRDL